MSAVACRGWCPRCGWAQRSFDAFGYRADLHGEHELATEIDAVDTFIHLVLRLLDHGIAPRFNVDTRTVLFYDSNGYATVHINAAGIDP